MPGAGWLLDVLEKQLPHFLFDVTLPAIPFHVNEKTRGNVLKTARKQSCEECVKWAKGMRG